VEVDTRTPEDLDRLAYHILLERDAIADEHEEIAEEDEKIANEEIAWAEKRVEGRPHLRPSYPPSHQGAGGGVAAPVSVAQLPQQHPQHAMGGGVPAQTQQRPGPRRAIASRTRARKHNHTDVLVLNDPLPQ